MDVTRSYRLRKEHLRRIYKKKSLKCIDLKKKDAKQKKYENHIAQGNKHTQKWAEKEVAARLL